MTQQRKKEREYKHLQKTIKKCESLYVSKEYFLEAMVYYSYKQACTVYSMQYTIVMSIQRQKEKCMNTNMKKYHAR